MGYSVMSALPLQAGIRASAQHVRFVPNSDLTLIRLIVPNVFKVPLMLRLKNGLGCAA
jgi:hypothetical protein